VSGIDTLGHPVPTTASFSYFIGSITGHGATHTLTLQAPTSNCTNLSQPCLMFTNDQPVLHTTITHTAGGGYGYFNAILAVCEKNGGGWSPPGATQENTSTVGIYGQGDGPCTDPLGQAGTWFAVEYWNSTLYNTYTGIDEALPTTGLFGPHNLAQEVKVVYQYGYQAGMGVWHYVYAQSSPFQIVVIPS